MDNENNIQYDFPEISQNENFALFEKLKSDNIQNMNFDQYRNKVYKDLSSLETDIISSLSTHDKEFMEMFKNFEESDEILNTLESNLLTFKDKLSGINNDMKILQTKSTEISTKLKNRKEFEEELFKLLDSIILAPDFLNDIISKDIDDDFVNKINKLEEKLQTFIGGDLPESTAINEIIPEIRKTLAKVCSKIYSSSTTKYCNELSKLLNDKIDKFSLTASEELNKDFFHLVNKRKLDSINNIEKESIIPIYAISKKESYYYEQIFQSLNKFLMDLITWEVLFFNDFFDMGIQQSAIYLNNIYKNSVNTIYEYIQKNLIGKNNDYFAISFMIIINFEQKKLMEKLNLNHLDYYFYEINKLLWPKFDQIYKLTSEQIFKVNMKNTKLFSNGIHSVTHKLGEFLSIINLISKQTTNTPMIFAKLKEIQNSFNQFFYELTENMKFSNNNEREEMVTIFFINNVYYLLVKLNDFDAMKEENDPQSFDKVLNNKRENYLNILVKKHFDEINKILQKCINKNNQSSGQNIIFLDNEVKKLTKNELKSAAQHFNNKYRDILNTVKKDIYSNIKDPENAKLTYTKFLSELLNRYASFVDLLRTSKNDDLLMTVVSVQKLMIEINNITKTLNN